MVTEENNSENVYSAEVELQSAVKSSTSSLESSFNSNCQPRSETDSEEETATGEHRASLNGSQAAQADPAASDSPRLTDTSMAQYVTGQLGEQGIYCKEQGLFVLYDDQRQRWIKDHQRHDLRKTIRRILHGFPQKLTADVKAQEKIYQRIESSSVPSSVAREMELVVAQRSIEEFDDNIYLFGVRNGVIELNTGVFRPGNAKDLLTKTAAVAYDPQARCPQFEKFVAEIMCGKQDLIDYLQTMMGYFLLGDNPENLLLFLLGRGANGKTVLLNVIENLFGDYCNAIPLSVMIKTQRETVGDDIMAIVGYRVLMSRELEKDNQFNSAKIKKLVGGDSERARNLYDDHERVWVKGKFVIATNEIPRIEDRSNGIWRRLKLIPFLRVFQENEQIKRYEDILLKEKPGILNWALDGLKKYDAHGFQEPEICRKYINDLRGEVNPVEEFIAEYYVASKADRVAARPLHQHYIEWAEKTPNAPHLSAKRFATELRSLGIQRYRPQGSVYGLKLRGSRAVKGENTPE